MTPDDEVRRLAVARMRGAVDDTMNALERYAANTEAEWESRRWKSAFVEFVGFHMMALIAVGCGWAIMSAMTDKNGGVKLMFGCLVSIGVLAGTSLWRGWVAVREDIGPKPKSFDFLSRHAFVVGSLGGGVSAAAIVGAIMAVGLVESAKGVPEDHRMLIGLGWRLWGSSMALAAVVFATLYGCGALVSHLLFRPSTQSHP